MKKLKRQSENTLRQMKKKKKNSPKSTQYSKSSLFFFFFKSSLKTEVYTDTGLSQEIKKSQINNPNDHLTN